MRNSVELAAASALLLVSVPVVASFEAYQQAVKDGHAGPEPIVDAVGPHPTRLLYRYLVDRLSPAVERVIRASRRSK